MELAPPARRPSHALQWRTIPLLGVAQSIDGGHELFLRRETIVLTGNGVISPAMHPARAEADPIRFEIIRR